jgi:hypothetical protein
MSSPKYELLVGVDWGSENHAVCVLNAQREELHRWEIRHGGEGLFELAERLDRLVDGRVEGVAVGIETPRGPVVETLVERGFHVFALNPKQLDRFRDRHSVAGAKDDPLDAFVLADALGTDLRLFRRVRLDQPAIIKLREATRANTELGQEAKRLANRLREQLHRYFPQLLGLCAAADERWLWSLLELAQTPAAARKLKRAQLGKVLKTNRIRRITIDDLVAALKERDVQVADGVWEGSSVRVRMLVEQLRLVDRQRHELGKLIDGLLEKLCEPSDEDAPEGQKREHRDAEIFLSLPGAGRVVVATMLAEASQPLAERDYDSLRRLTGAAPVTRRTGKQGRGGRPVPVMMRRACNERAREAIYHWSRVATQHDERCRALYAEHRKKGQSHGRALRSVSDHQLRVLIAMLEHGALFDAERRRGSQPATAEAA